nr:hypothetical protein [uncultured Kingella sp.]
MDSFLGRRHLLPTRFQAALLRRVERVGINAHPTMLGGSLKSGL